MHRGTEGRRGIVRLLVQKSGGLNGGAVTLAITLPCVDAAYYTYTNDPENRAMHRTNRSQRYTRVADFGKYIRVGV